MKMCIIKKSETNDAIDSGNGHKEFLESGIVESSFMPVGMNGENYAGVYDIKRSNGEIGNWRYQCSLSTRTN